MIDQFLFLGTTGAVAPAILLQQNEPPLERLVNALGLIILLLLVSICLIAFFLVLTALLPTASTRSQAALSRSPWRAFFIGLANYLFLGGLGLVLLSTGNGALGLVGVLMIAFLTAITAIGLTGLVALTGARVAALQSAESSPFKQLAWGTTALALAGLLPFVGWFLLTPGLLLTAFGAAVLAWRSRKQPEPEQPLSEQ
jgi:hypothetical protein